MPEGVEVKLSSEIINPLVVGKVINSIYLGNGRYKVKPPEGYKEFREDIQTKQNEVKSVKILEVKTRGKFMYWKFDNDWYMFSTFGMTGQWSPNDSQHTCFQFSLLKNDNYAKPESHYSNMYFNDPRHFGTIKFTKSEKELKEKLNELGWDPLQDDMMSYLPWLITEIKGSKKSICEILMNQKVFAGVGNYIRAEALYLAKISPWRIGNQFSEDDIKLLCQSIIIVMQDSYAHQGATIQTYKTPYGEEGRYSSSFKVYGKKQDSFGNKVKKEKSPDKRSIHWVPEIQK